MKTLDKLKIINDINSLLNEREDAFCNGEQIGMRKTLMLLGYKPIWDSLGNYVIDIKRVK